MKKLFTILTCAAMFLCSCGGNKDGNGSSNDSLKGKYTIDVSNAGALFESEFKSQNIPSSMLSMIVSQLDLTVEFDGQKATVDAGTTVSMLIKSATNGEYSFPMELEYKLENDSILYLKDDDEFEKAGTIIPASQGNYDKVIYRPKYKGSSVDIELQRQ